ncbi:hypothetical protein DVH24_041100 [Malus domestica]|uniref:Uncharacterized protein n=1 Tax=Malus domestica TaxID=3750 RepID=A0A498IFE1_MALDO|nr:hypothetical protein DVH24_041100 [Malus domestica]
MGGGEWGLDWGGGVVRLQMSQLIKQRRSVSRSLPTPPPPTPTVATAPLSLAPTSKAILHPPQAPMSIVIESSTSPVTHPLLSAQRTHRQAELPTRMAQIITAFMRGGFDIPATTPHTTTPSTSQALDPAQPTAEANSDDFLF